MSLHFLLRVSWLCALSAPVLIVALALYVTHTRLALGHWPVPHTDYDLGDLHDIHNILFGLLYLFAVYGALPIWLICLFLSRSQPDAREWWVQASVFFGSWGIIVLAAYFDPTTFTKWFLD
jgi:hypothetical protein